MTAFQNFSGATTKASISMSLRAKSGRKITPEEYEARKKSEFLLGIKLGDYVVYVNLPTWEK